MPVTDKVARHKRSAWMPIVEDGDGPLEGSKFSGTPVLRAGEDWPRCPGCQGPMQLFIQLGSDDVPLGAPRFGDGILQLFYCTSTDPLCEVDCEAFAPFGRSVLARIVERAGGVAPASGPEDPFPARRIAGWRRVDDYPNYQELEEAGVELDDEELDELAKEYPVAGDKLGGWPQWIQGVEYPECTQCGQRMTYLLQIDSEDNLPIMFGDVGTGHLSQCPDHRHVLSFHWACS